MENHILFKCENCGSADFVEREDGELECKYCHATYRKKPNNKIEMSIGDKTASIDFGDMGEKLGKTVKDNKKIIFGIMSILFGNIGINHLLMGEIGKFVLSFLFCWTLVPTIIGLVQGIKALSMSKEEFEELMKKHPKCLIK